MSDRADRKAVPLGRTPLAHGRAHPFPPPAPLITMRAMRIRLADLAATEALAARLAALARAGDAILLAGPLGAGKSALARAFLRAATRDPALEVPSPSFTLVQSYPLPSGVLAHHFDLYRLDGPAALAELGWEEALEGIVLVEWPDRLGPLAPSGALQVTLTPCDADARDAVLTGWEGRL